jgi:hypothetical protein
MRRAGSGALAGRGGCVIGTTSRLFLCLASVIALGACATVPQNRRGRLADPMMSLTDDALETYRKQKLYVTREGAAGGDGTAAGGGCGCH